MTEETQAPALGAPAGADTSSEDAGSTLDQGQPAPLSIGDAPAPAPALPAEPTAGATVVEFQPTGDSGLDMALGFFGKLGLGPGDAAFDAAANGDFAMLKARMGQLGDKARGYEGFVALAEQAYAKGKEEHDAKAAADKAAVIDTVGGEQQWEAIQKWASANAEPAEKAAVNAAFKQGGVAAKAMAMWLNTQYAKAVGTTVEPAPVTQPGASRAGGNQSGALSAKAYAAAVQEARSRLGYAFDGSREYESLQARRMAGQRSGI